MKRKRISQVVVFAVACMGSVCFIGSKSQCEKVAQVNHGTVAPLHTLRENYVNLIKPINANFHDKRDNRCKVFIPAPDSDKPHSNIHHDEYIAKLREGYRERHRKTIQSIQNEFRLYSNEDKRLVMTDERKGERKRDWKSEGKDERVRKLFKKITSQDLQTLENISLITSTPT